jgi:Domain of unknown function (DUF1918)
VSFTEVAPAASGRFLGCKRTIVDHALLHPSPFGGLLLRFTRERLVLQGVSLEVSFSGGKAVEQHLREFAQGGREMEAHIGDSIVVESERVGQPAHTGVIEDVLQQQPPRYRVRWEDGHESIVTPAAGAAKIEPKQTAH